MSHAEVNILDNLESFLESASNIAISTEGFDLDAELSSLDAELAASVEVEADEEEEVAASVSSVDDELAALMDEISGSVTPKEKETKAAEADDELAALLGELDDVTGSEVKVEEKAEAPAVEAKSAADDLDDLAAELALASEELLSELDELEAIEATEPKKAVKPKKTTEAAEAKQKKVKAPKVEGDLSVQLKAAYGDDSAIFALTDAGEFGQAELDAFFVEVDALAVKTKQKAANLVAFWKAGSSLSVYTEIGIKLLTEKGEMTTADLREAYMTATPKAYTYGTASSQTGQVFQLLPAFGLATRLDRDKLTLNEDSAIAKLFIKLNK